MRLADPTVRLKEAAGRQEDLTVRGNPPVISSNDLPPPKPQNHPPIPMNNPLLLLICLVIPLMIWDGVWKRIALWQRARNDQLPWFICLALFNPAGTPPLRCSLCFPKSGSPPPVAKT
jgi:hypothetical protein